MAIQMKTVALTAVGGMVAGLVGCGGAPAVPETPEAPDADPPAADPASDLGGIDDAAGDEDMADAGAKDCCKGMNDCKGQGGCKVDGSHDCKGMNECKGQGGCKPADCE